MISAEAVPVRNPVFLLDSAAVSGVEQAVQLMSAVPNAGGKADDVRLNRRKIHKRIVPVDVDVGDREFDGREPEDGGFLYWIQGVSTGGLTVRSTPKHILPYRLS